MCIFLYRLIGLAAELGEQRIHLFARADKSRLRAEIVALRLVGGGLRRNLAVEKIGLSRPRLGVEVEIGLRLFDLRPGLRIVRLGCLQLVHDNAELRLGALARDAIGLVVEAEQQIALPDVLPLLYVHLDDDAGNVVCDIDDVGLHVGVVGRREAAAREIGPEPERDGDKGAGNKQRSAQIARLLDLWLRVKVSVLLLARRFRSHRLKRRAAGLGLHAPCGLSHGSPSAPAPRLPPACCRPPRDWPSWS